MGRHRLGASISGRRLGAARAPSPDAPSAPPGLRSLGAACAPPILGFAGQLRRLSGQRAAPSLPDRRPKRRRGSARDGERSLQRRFTGNASGHAAPPASNRGARTVAPISDRLARAGAAVSDRRIRLPFRKSAVRDRRSSAGQEPHALLYDAPPVAAVSDRRARTGAAVSDRRARLLGSRRRESRDRRSETADPDGVSAASTHRRARSPFHVKTGRPGWWRALRGLRKVRGFTWNRGPPPAATLRAERVLAGLRARRSDRA